MWKNDWFLIWILALILLGILFVFGPHASLDLQLIFGATYVVFAGWSSWIYARRVIGAYLPTDACDEILRNFTVASVTALIFALGGYITEGLRPDRVTIELNLVIAWVAFILVLMGALRREALKGGGAEKD